MSFIFVFLVNNTASQFGGLKLSFTDTPHLWMTSGSELAMDWILSGELLIMLHGDTDIML